LRNVTGVVVVYKIVTKHDGVRDQSNDGNGRADADGGPVRPDVRRDELPEVVHSI
jgi:hypothetical protein